MLNTYFSQVSSNLNCGLIKAQGRYLLSPFNRKHYSIRTIKANRIRCGYNVHTACTRLRYVLRYVPYGTCRYKVHTTPLGRIDLTY